MPEYFPAIPVEVLDAWRERAPALHGPEGQWRLRTRTFLIEHPSGLIAVDTGIGPVTSPAVDWFGATGHLMDRLDELGVAPTDVDILFVTHVHDDHIGGTATEQGTPAFPNARYVIQRADWVWIMSEVADDLEAEAIARLLLEPIEEAGRLDLADGDVRIADGVEGVLVPGHTPGHQILRIASGDARLTLSGDTFNHPAQLTDLSWASGSDDDPDTAGHSRAAWVERLAAEGDTVAPAHFAEPFGTVVRDGEAYGWVPLPS
jgi:glyoxylase-like metal-dependent hydrolase (beta-lactamase superfamily II)